MDSNKINENDNSSDNTNPNYKSESSEMSKTSLRGTSSEETEEQKGNTVNSHENPIQFNNKANKLNKMNEALSPTTNSRENLRNNPQKNNLIKSINLASRNRRVYNRILGNGRDSAPERNNTRIYQHKISKQGLQSN